MWKTKKSKRSTEESVAEETVEPEKTPKDLRRQGRGLCDKNYGMSVNLVFTNPWPSNDYNLSL